MKVIKFTEEQEKEIQTIARSTWQVIGGDILQCTEKSSMSAREVVEAVMDASYMKTNGLSHSKASEETRKIIDDMYSSPEMIKAVEKQVKIAFSAFKRYGL